MTAVDPEPPFPQSFPTTAMQRKRTFPFESSFGSFSPENRCSAPASQGGLEEGAEVSGVAGPH